LRQKGKLNLFSYAYDSSKLRYVVVFYYLSHTATRLQVEKLSITPFKRNNSINSLT